MPRRSVRALVLAVALPLAALALQPTAAYAQAAPVGGPMLGTTGTVVAPGDTPLPKVSALGWLVADATSGKVLAAHDPHGRFYPASTLKTLTALTVLPALTKASTYVARDQDVRAEGSQVGIVAGATYSVDDLFNALFLESGNDAASALANAYGGWSKTVAAENANAQRLQAYDTTVLNPSGLDHKGQLSSAYDLALIARAGEARPDFRHYTSTQRYRFPGKMPKKPGAHRTHFQIQNQNRLLMEGFPGMVGVKTGYTTMAGRTYVGGAMYHGHLVLVTLMHVAGMSDVAARKLLVWGFKNLSRPGVGVLVDPVPVGEVTSAAGPSPSVAAAHVAPVTAGSGLPSKAWLGVAVGAGLLLLAGALRRRQVRARARARARAREARRRPARL